MRNVLVLGLLLLNSVTNAFEARLTYKDTTDSSVEHMLSVINLETGVVFKKSDFLQLEKREFATSNFLMLAQIVNGVPVMGANIRIWSNKEDGHLIQAEMKIKV